MIEVLIHRDMVNIEFVGEDGARLHPQAVLYRIASGALKMKEEHETVGDMTLRTRLLLEGDVEGIPFKHDGGWYAILAGLSVSDADRPFEPMAVWPKTQEDADFVRAAASAVYVPDEYDPEKEPPA